MKFCYAENCIKEVRAKGLCKDHYQRMLKYGRLEKIVTGDKTKHPLYLMWNKRKNVELGFVKEWLDFDIFLNAVGDPPADCFLARLNSDKPCGPDNFEWRKIKVAKLDGETTKDYNLRRQAAYRLENPSNARASNYKLSFNLSLEEVKEKLKAQNYLCAICEQPETAKYKNTDNIKTLALDHCHTTGKIREFLCSKCNLFVGKVEKDRTLINKIEKYLDRWQAQHAIL